MPETRLKVHIFPDGDYLDENMKFHGKEHNKMFSLFRRISFSVLYLRIN
jgi:hypothetical protein